MKKVITISVTVLLVGLTAFKLYANKEEMKENAKLSEITTESIPVEAHNPSWIALSEPIMADGTFTAKTDVNIISETQGKVVAVYKERGATVRKGELLAQVENTVIAAQVEAARANYLKLQSDSVRFTKLSESDAVTQRQLEEVRIGLLNAKTQYVSAKKQLDDSYIRATTNGIINDDFIQEGEFIGPGTRLYNIVDVSQLKLNIRLTANEVMRIEEGQEVSITSSVLPTKTFTGKVAAIAAKADGALKYNVEITLQNGSSELKPGMYATANIATANDVKTLYIDRNAIIGSVQNPQVYVIEDGMAHLKSISVGEIKSQYVEVLSGLDSTEQVILTGQINLEEGSAVNALDRQ